MPWFHVLKARHEQQNTTDYLKKEVFVEKSQIFLKYVKKAARKKINITIICQEHQS